MVLLTSTRAPDTVQGSDPDVNAGSKQISRAVDREVLVLATAPLCPPLLVPALPSNGF